MSLTQGYPIFALIILLIGLFCVALACYNSYRYKSTELIDRYEERFFVRMKAERKYAAQYLLGEYPNSDQLEFVLDYFEAPIADKMLSRLIMESQIYEYFRHWIILYYLAAQEYIEIYRKNDDVVSWSHLKPLYDRMIELKKQQCEKELGRKCTEKDVIPNQEKLKEYLLQEARLQ
jgi:hypothetical protein